MPADSSSNFALGVKKLSSKRVIAAALSLEKGKFIVDDLVEDSIEPLLAKYLPVTALRPQDLLIRQIELPAVKKKELADVLAFQVEPLLPYPIEDAELDYLIHDEGETTKLTYVAAKLDSIAAHIEEMKEEGIDPECIGTEPQSFAAFTYFVTGAAFPLFSIYIDEEVTFVVASVEGKLIACHAFEMGVAEVMSPLFKMKIAQQVLSLTKQLSMPLMRQIFIASVKPLDSYEFLLPDGTTLLKMDEELDREQLEFYALAVGNAINGLRGTVNFRKNRFAYPNPWKRIKSSIIYYYGATLGLSFAIFVSGWAYFSYQEAGLKQKWVDQLSAMGKDSAVFEERFAEKFGNGDDLVLKEVDDYTLEDLTDRIAFIQKEVQATPNLFALHPNVPRVSDLLAYLATHPQVTMDEGSKIKINSLSYQMVKRPDMGKKLEKYQVKVDLEFTTDVPKLAREFHDALIAPNEFIDAKSEIKWSTNRGSFRASFFLKDRTQYPS